MATIKSDKGPRFTFDDRANVITCHRPFPVRANVVSSDANTRGYIVKIFEEDLSKLEESEIRAMHSRMFDWYYYTILKNER